MHGIFDLAPVNFYPALALGFMVTLIRERRAITKAVIVSLIVAAVPILLQMAILGLPLAALFFAVFGLPFALAGALAGSLLARMAKVTLHSRR